MWDLTISNLHDFAVGTDAYVVHNCDSTKVDFNREATIQHEYKHAEDFGVTGNYDTAHGQAFREAMKAHIEDPDTVEISGEYKRKPVTHYYNPRTDLNVFADSSGRFAGAWRLGPKQVWWLITTHHLS